VLAQDLGHARCLDLGPVGEHLADHRLEAVDLRARRAPAIARRLLGGEHPPDVLRLSPRRATISRCEIPSAAIALTCAHSNALRACRARRIA